MRLSTSPTGRLVLHMERVREASLETLGKRRRRRVRMARKASLMSTEAPWTPLVLEPWTPPPARRVRSPRDLRSEP